MQDIYFFQIFFFLPASIAFPFGSCLKYIELNLEKIKKTARPDQRATGGIDALICCPSVCVCISDNNKNDSRLRDSLSLNKTAVSTPVFFFSNTFRTVASKNFVKKKKTRENRSKEAADSPTAPTLYCRLQIKDIG